MSTLPSIELSFRDLELPSRSPTLTPSPTLTSSSPSVYTWDEALAMGPSTSPARGSPPPSIDTWIEAPSLGSASSLSLISVEASLVEPGDTPAPSLSSFDTDIDGPHLFSLPPSTLNNNPPSDPLEENESSDLDNNVYGHPSSYPASFDNYSPSVALRPVSFDDTPPSVDEDYHTTLVRREVIANFLPPRHPLEWATFSPRERRIWDILWERHGPSSGYAAMADSRPFPDNIPPGAISRVSEEVAEQFRRESSPRKRFLRLLGLVRDFIWSSATRLL
jgi:hypothetical protein